MGHRDSPSELASRVSAQRSLPIPARLDVLLAEVALEHSGANALSRSQLKREIEAGRVTVNGKVVDVPGRKIVGDVTVEFNIYADERVIFQPDPTLPIIFEDDAVVVVNKPAGLTVHPGAGRRAETLVNKLLPKLATTDRLRPGIVHRLDKDTTGLLVVAKTPQAHAALARQFAAHTTRRRYRALLLATPRNKRGALKEDEGTIDAALGRREKIVVIDPSGRRAVTHWRVVERLGYGVIVELRLETGRTHQIRVHTASLGCPVIGDRTYGDFSALPKPLFRLHDSFGRQALHAQTLGFTHPFTGEELSFSVAPPKEHAELEERFRAFGSGTR
jgi:23S rRNA pseudouridine1911/1915/1917 synthase